MQEVDLWSETDLMKPVSTLMSAAPVRIGRMFSTPLLTQTSVRADVAESMFRALTR